MQHRMWKQFREWERNFEKVSLARALSQANPAVSFRKEFAMDDKFEDLVRRATKEKKTST